MIWQLPGRQNQTGRTSRHFIVLTDALALHDKARRGAPPLSMVMQQVCVTQRKSPKVWFCCLASLSEPAFIEPRFKVFWCQHVVVAPSGTVSAPLPPASSDCSRVQAFPDRTSFGSDRLGSPHSGGRFALARRSASEKPSPWSALPPVAPFAPTGKLGRGGTNGCDQDLVHAPLLNGRALRT